MKFPHLLLVVAALSLAGCEKIKSLAASGTSKAPSELTSEYSGPLVSELDETSYESFPLKSGRVVVIDFYADWCGPCRQLSPILDSIALENGGKVLVGRVNVDKCGKIASAEGVSGIPDVRIFREGKLVDKFVGCPEENEVRQRIKSQTNGLPALPSKQSGTGKSKADEPVAKPMPKDWLPPGLKRR